MGCLSKAEEEDCYWLLLLSKLILKSEEVFSATVFRLLLRESSWIL